MNESAKKAGRFYAEASEARRLRPDTDIPLLTAETAGYETSATASVPKAALEASFGCGDPVATARVQAGQTVLDLGCGAGLDLILAAERTGETGRVIGVDGSEEMLEIARRHIADANLGAVVELRQGLIEKLPVESESVDWVISNCVVNLSGDKQRVFREIHRVLKPGGTAVIADLVAETLPEWVHIHEDLLSSCVSGTVSENHYLELAQAAGLVDGRILGRLTYDQGMILGLIRDALPIALSEIALRLDLTEEALLSMASSDLAGQLSSVRFSFSKPH